MFVIIFLAVLCALIARDIFVIFFGAEIQQWKVNRLSPGDEQVTHYEGPIEW
jgi:hypothetical protein